MTVAVPSYRPRYRSENRYKSSGPTLFTYVGGQLAGVGTYVGDKRWMNDTVFRNFRKRRDAGEIMVGAAKSRHFTVASEQTSLYEGYQSGTSREVYGNTMWYKSWALNSPGDDPMDRRFQLLSSKDVDTLIDEVSTRALGNIHTSEAGMAENVAEASSTINMLRHPISSFWRFHKKQKAKSLVMSAASAWLMYRYGIRPLVLSTVEALEILAKANRPVRQTTRARGSLTANESTISVARTGANDIADLGIQKTESVICRAWSIDEVIGNTITDLGFGGKDLLRLPWNLVTASFVADWFVNIGDFIGAVAQSFYPASLGRCYTTRHVVTDMRTVYNYRKSASAPSNYSVITGSEGWWRCDDVWYVREPFLRAPRIVVKANFGFHNAARIADAYALIAQVISAFSTRGR